MSRKRDRSRMPDPARRARDERNLSDSGYGILRCNSRRAYPKCGPRRPPTTMFVNRGVAIPGIERPCLMGRQKRSP